MKKATDADDIVSQLIRRFPKADKRTLARKLHHDYPAQFPTVEKARTAVRYRCGANGRVNRKHVAGADTVRPHGTVGLSPLPESIEENWEPFVIENATRTLAIGDLHIPFHSVKAIKATLDWADGFNPTAIFINGDLFDFYQLSRFDKKPTLTSVKAELLAGGEFLDHLSQRFPRAKKYFKLGNHDERWAKYLFNAAPLLSDVDGIEEGWQIPAGIVRNKVTVIGDKRPVMLGKLPMLHGHELPGASSPVNPARGAFLRTNHTIAINHHHRSSSHGDPDLWHEETFAWSIGCICGLTPHYMPVNKWNWGFAAIEVRKDGSFDFHNKRISRDGQVRAS